MRGSYLQYDWVQNMVLQHNVDSRKAKFYLKTCVFACVEYMGKIINVVLLRVVCSNIVNGKNIGIKCRPIKRLWVRLILKKCRDLSLKQI